MKYWITEDGRYYASEFNLNSSDSAVSKRPHKRCNYINGRWVCPNDIVKVTESVESKNQHIVLEEKQDIDHTFREVSSQKIEKQDNVVLNENTKLLFGVKDILIICSFIVTATISWQDTDSRISKLEDNKAITQVEDKIKTIELDVKASEKQVDSKVKTIEQNIRELEQVIFMKNTMKNTMK